MCASKYQYIPTVVLPINSFSGEVSMCQRGLRFISSSLLVLKITHSKSCCKQPSAVATESDPRSTLRGKWQGLGEQPPARSSARYNPRCCGLKIISRSNRGSHLERKSCHASPGVVQALGVLVSLASLSFFILTSMSLTRSLDNVVYDVLLNSGCSNGEQIC